jgi:CBS domain-containing protein
MEKNATKRVPILENGQLIGIVSRANLIQAVATARKLLYIPLSDTTIRENLLSHLKKQPWAHTSMLNVTVNGGVVDLWGIAELPCQRQSDHPIRRWTGVNSCIHQSSPRRHNPYQ